MKKITLAITFIAVVMAGAIVACNSSSAKTVSDDNGPAFHYTKEQAEHGKYLVTAMGCGDCHTPLKMGPMGPEPDTARFLSGHPMQVPVPHVDTTVLKDWVMFNHTNTAIAGPWGVSFTANLTSDPTGIGYWSFNQFKTALTKGKFKGLDSNRSILPPMPWQNYVNLKDEDLRDIFAFLKSTKPVHNVVPTHIPPTNFQ